MARNKVEIDFDEWRKKIENMMKADNFNSDIAEFIQKRFEEIDKGEVDDPELMILSIMVGLDFSENGTGDPNDFLTYFMK